MEKKKYQKSTKKVQNTKQYTLHITYKNQNNTYRYI